MKPLLSAIATALILFSAQGVAEQTHAAGCYFLWQCRGCSPIAGTTTV